ncbi:hypothetical protein GmRootV59_55380 (plasmid) [Variovorax sp. V59]
MCRRDGLTADGDGIDARCKRATGGIATESRRTDAGGPCGCCWTDATATECCRIVDSGIGLRTQGNAPSSHCFRLRTNSDRCRAAGVDIRTDSNRRLPGRSDSTGARTNVNGVGG